MNYNGPILLNLASGTDLRDPPWVNLDVVAKWPGTKRGCDILWDARKEPIPCVDAKADGVYAGFLFLHLAPQHHQRVLGEIFRVMKPGGLFVVGEVDMALVLPRWLENPTDPRLAELIWGEQGDVHGSALAEFDKHCHGYTEATLKAFLVSGGFPTVERIPVDNSTWYEMHFKTNKPGV